MAKKITYLLGAGASANTIPVVADFLQRLNEVREYLNDCLPSAYIKTFEVPEKYVDVVEKIIGEFDWLTSEAGNYYTIDTLAKRYYLLKDRSNLNRLKNCLITYFTLEQYIFIESTPADNYHFKKTKIDKRYGSFLASIAKIKPEVVGKKLSERELLDWIGLDLDKDIKILSWNYDLQFELNLARLFLDKKIHFIQSSFQIFPNEETIFESNSLKIETNKFSMVKLNGNAIWNQIERYQRLNYTETVFDYNTKVSDNNVLLLHFLEEYSLVRTFNPIEANSDEPLPIFNFAWENDKTFTDKYIGHSKNLEAAERIASETDILVIIGYSFPIFNREIDNRLFSKMGKLEKIYIQDKNPDRIESTMRNAFKILQEKKIVDNMGNEADYVPRAYAHNYTKVDKVSIQLEPYTDQFVIPYELNQD